MKYHDDAPKLDSLADEVTPAEGLVHEQPDTPRKAFVRAHVHRALGRSGKPSRSKDPIRREICNGIRQILANTRQGRLMLVQEANFAWQKQQLREFLRSKDEFSYTDMKSFIQANGWEELWIPTKRLPAYWRAICRTGRL